MSLGFDRLVALADDDGVHAVLTRTRVGFEPGLLDRTVLGTHDDEVVVDVLLVVQTLDVDVGADLVVGFDLDDVLDGTALRRAGAFRNLVHLEPEAAALLREEEHRIVH